MYSSTALKITPTTTTTTRPGPLPPPTLPPPPLPPPRAFPAPPPPLYCLHRYRFPHHGPTENTGPIADTGSATLHAAATGCSHPCQSDFTGTTEGNRHYSTGAVEGPLCCISRQKQKHGLDGRISNKQIHILLEGIHAHHVPRASRARHHQSTHTPFG